MQLPFRVPPRDTFAFDVVAFGENSVDLVATVDRFPLPDGKQPLASLAQRPGGQVATAAAACARLGWRTRYVGAFGDDGLGRVGRESLASEGVDLSACRERQDVSSRSALILVDASAGTRSVLFLRDPRLAVAAGEVDADVWRSGRMLLVDGTDLEAATAAAQTARAVGIPVVADLEEVEPGTADLLAHVDVLIASTRFPERLTGVADPRAALAAVASTFALPLLVVTRGEQGSLAWCRGQEIQTAAFPVGCVDSTGAGDAFHGGFIAACLAQPDGTLEGALRYANAVAALNCRGAGARGGLPGPDEVERLLGSTPGPC